MQPPPSLSHGDASGATQPQHRLGYDEGELMSTQHDPRADHTQTVGVPRPPLLPSGVPATIATAVVMTDTDLPPGLCDEQLAGLLDHPDFANMVKDDGPFSSSQISATTPALTGSALSPVLESTPGTSLSPGMPPVGNVYDHAFGSAPLEAAGASSQVHNARKQIPTAAAYPAVAVAIAWPPTEQLSRGPQRGTPTIERSTHAPERETAKESNNSRKDWNVAEDDLILECVKQLGCKWRQIASMLPGRSDDAVRNRWNRLTDPSSNAYSSRELSLGSREGTLSSGYRCSKCGQPKKNHRCTWVPSPHQGAPPSVARIATDGTEQSPREVGSREGVQTDSKSSRGRADIGTEDRHRSGQGIVSAGPFAGGTEGEAVLSGTTTHVGRAPPKVGADVAQRVDGREKRRPERLGWKVEEDALITRSVEELGHRWLDIAERLPGRTEHAIRNRWHRLLTMRQDRMQQVQHNHAHATVKVIGAIVGADPDDTIDSPDEQSQGSSVGPAE
jgi:hypothetical protein